MIIFISSSFVIPLIFWFLYPVNPKYDRNNSCHYIWETEMDLNSMTADSQCTFDGEGPLNWEELQCFKHYFPFYAETRAQSSDSNIVHNMKGIEWRNGPPPVPIIMVTKDKLTVLVESLRSYHKHLRTPFEIVIHDENSTFPPTVRFLKKLERAGVKVYWHDDFQDGMDEVSKRVATTVSDWMENSKSHVYIVTDPDVGLDNVPGHLLYIYQHLMETLKVKVVGASMRWDDWPKEILDIGFEKPKDPPPAKYVLYEGRPVYYVEYPVDTTFAMYHRSTTFGRLTSPAIRVLPPLASRHLDFYWTPQNNPPDMVHYVNRVKHKKITHMLHLG